MFNKLAGFVRRGVEVVKQKVGTALACAGAVAGLALAPDANAQAATVDYGQTVVDNFAVIETIWGKVAVIIIGVALVKVAVGFFYKAH